MVVLRPIAQFFTRHPQALKELNAVKEHHASLLMLVDLPFWKAVLLDAIQNTAFGRAQTCACLHNRRDSISGSKLDPRFSPPFGFKNAPTSENVDHLPRDKFSVDRFAFCMSLMVTLANCSHSSLHPLQNQCERFNEKRNSNSMWSSKDLCAKTCLTRRHLVWGRPALASSHVD